MAIQQLTQPIINPIAAFDATLSQEITFLVIGGAQVLGNRIVISDNQTGDIVYDNKVTTMKLSHVIPANTLTNGGYYNVVIYTLGSLDSVSSPSVPVPFYCYSQPVLTINNIPATETIENGTYTFQGNYLQQENEVLDSYQFILYDSNKNILSKSDVIYYQTNNSLSYTFVGMSNDTSYYIELKGQTVNSTLITTGLLYFTVRYSQPASFAIVDLVNDCANGYIQISSNIVAIDGKAEPAPPVYIDNKEVDLRRRQLSMSSNMNDGWFFYNPQVFNIEYVEKTDTNNITVDTAGGWEIVFIPLALTPNKRYSINFDCDILTPYEVYDGYDGIRYQALSKVGNYNNLDNEIASGSLSTEIGSKNYTLEFVPETETVYFAFNFGVVKDYTQVKLKISNIKLWDDEVYVKWDNGFDVKDDFTMRVWGRGFEANSPIITMKSQYNTQSSPNKIEMKWMIADVLETLPDYTLVEGKNISIVNGYETNINDLSIYGNSEQIKKDSVNLGKAQSLTLNTTKNMYLDIDVYGNSEQKIYEGYNLFNNNSQNFPATIPGLEINFRDDGSISAKGTATSTWNRKRSNGNIYNIEAGTYTLYLKVNGSCPNAILSIALEDADMKTITRGRVGVSNSSLIKVVTFTCDVTTEIKYTSITLEGIKTNIAYNCTFYPMLLTGAYTTDVEYEPYTGGIPSPNPEFPSAIETVSDDVEINVTNNDNTKSQTATMPIQQEMLNGDYIADVEHHEWGKYVLTGDEEWFSNINTGWTQNEHIFGFSFSGIKTNGQTTNVGNVLICNYFECDNTSVLVDTPKNLISYYPYLRAGSILINHQGISTLTDFKAWLKAKYDAGNPVIVYYKLAEAINLGLTSEQKAIRNTLVNAYEPTTDISSRDNLSILEVSTTPTPSPKLPSKIYSSGDVKNQLEELGEINVEYNQGYFQTTDTNFVLKPDFVYNLSFDYTINSSTTDVYFTISYKSNGEIFDITDILQYASQTIGRNNFGFIVPTNIPSNSTLSIKFARTIIPADISVTVSHVSLTKGRFETAYQAPNICNIYPTATQKNIFNYNDIYYIRNENATLTYIQNGFSSEVVTTGEKSFFEFGFPNILQPGNKYAISYDSYGSIKSAKIYTMDKETGETLEQIVTENGVFTAPSNLYDIKAEFILDDTVEDNQVQVWNIQLESGEAVTGIESYISNSTDLTLITPLRKIGNYRDLVCLESPNILNPETQIAIVKGSTTYSLSQSGTDVYKFDYINEDDNVISSKNMANGQFTTPDNCVKIKFNTTSDIIITNKLQVNLGDTAMVYYPYVNEPSVIRYIKEIILTGDESWAMSANKNNVSYYLSADYSSTNNILKGVDKKTLSPTVDAQDKTIALIICNYFKIISPYSLFSLGEIGCCANLTGNETQLRLGFSLSSSLTDLTTFKAWLKSKYNEGNPVIVNYILANPTVEQLSSDNVLALKKIKTYDESSNVFTNNSMPANIDFSYISSQSEQESKNAYITLKCWSGHPMPYFVHSNYIDIPKETDKVFIWLRRRNNLFDLRIENLGDYSEDKPGDKGHPRVSITVDEITTTTITITTNTIDTATLKNIKFSKNNGSDWDAEIPLDGLSSSNTYTFTGLSPNVTYPIRAEAININDITGGITQQITTNAN